jgi:hypothetical protein
MSGQRLSDLSSFVQIFEQAFINLPNLSGPCDRPSKKVENLLKHGGKFLIYLLSADNSKYTSLK